MESRSGEVTRIVPGRMHRVIKARWAEGQVWARGHRALTAAWTPGAAGQVEARWTLELQAGEVLQAWAPGWGPGPHSPFLPLAAESWAAGADYTSTVPWTEADGEMGT